MGQGNSQFDQLKDSVNNGTGKASTAVDIYRDLKAKVVGKGAFHANICGCCSMRDCGPGCCFNVTCAPCCCYADAMKLAGLGSFWNTCMCCLVCPCFTSMKNRIQMVQTYKLQEEIDVSVCLGCCCAPCSAMQVVNEIMVREKQKFGCCAVDSTTVKEQIMHQY